MKCDTQTIPGDARGNSPTFFSVDGKPAAKRPGRASLSLAPVSLALAIARTFVAHGASVVIALGSALTVPSSRCQADPAGAPPKISATAPSALGTPQTEKESSKPGPSGAAGTSPSGSPRLALVPVASGYQKPVRIVTAPDQAGTVYVVEQEGRILTLNRDEKARTVVLDLTQELLGATGEGGFLGLAFHPRFAENGLFYLAYTSKSRTFELRISEFPTTAGRADPESARTLIRIPIQALVHLGGGLAFGPDDRLYISIGDGSEGNDPQNRGQNRNDQFGSILRIAPERDETIGKDYIPPPDNPFVTNDLGNREVWAYGFRNPRTFTFDSLTRALWVGDGGNGLEQEIDLVKPGGNYGWSVFDGNQCLRMRFECLDRGYLGPVATYGASEGSAIVVGPVYYGAVLPSLEGMLLYGDGKSGKLWGLKSDRNGATTKQVLMETHKALSAIAMGPHDSVLMADYTKGEIYELKEAAEETRAAPAKPPLIHGTP